jgi:hypothetical protein
LELEAPTLGMSAAIFDGVGLSPPPFRCRTAAGWMAGWPQGRAVCRFVPGDMTCGHWVAVPGSGSWVGCFGAKAGRISSGLSGAVSSIARHQEVCSPREHWPACRGSARAGRVFSRCRPMKYHSRFGVFTLMLRQAPGRLRGLVVPLPAGAMLTTIGSKGQRLGRCLHAHSAIRPDLACR